jgi:hypothetical protein
MNGMAIGLTFGIIGVLAMVVFGHQSAPFVLGIVGIVVLAAYLIKKI